MSEKHSNSPVPVYGTRRGYVLNRFGWGCAALALGYAIFGNKEPVTWTIVIILGVVAAGSLILAPLLDRKGRRSIEVDEKGNAKKRIL